MVRSRISKRLCGHVAGGLMALAIGLGFAGGALADNRVTTRVVGGALTASIQNLSLGNVTYSHAAVPKSGTMVLTVDDKTGTNAGWHVTVQASTFDYTGTYGPSAITADNFRLDQAWTPARQAGQPVDGTNGPMVPAVSPVGTLDSARTVILANRNFGKGEYTQDLDVTLNVPADTVVGTYTSTLTVTAVAGPA